MGKAIAKRGTELIKSTGKINRPSYLKRQKEQKRNERATLKRQASRERRRQNQEQASPCRVRNSIRKRSSEYAGIEDTRYIFAFPDP
jgi:hypothetical protein